MDKNETPLISIAANIARLRKKQGLSQTALAEMLYVSNKTVSKWERGAGYPEITQVIRLASLFGVTVDNLIKGEKHGIDRYGQADRRISRKGDAFKHYLAFACSRRLRAEHAD